MSGKLFVISAPSGTGKTTLINKVLQNIASRFSIDRVVTYTSRSPRDNEQSGNDYHFISSQEFEQKIEKGFFLEWSGEYGNYYGTPRRVVDEVERGLSRILIIDHPGAQRVFEIAQDSTPILTGTVTSIWIFPPTISELERRLFSRGQNTKKQIQKRLNLARKELEKEQSNLSYDYKVLNDSFSKAVQELENLFICELEK